MRTTRSVSGGHRACIRRRVGLFSGDIQGLPPTELKRDLAALQRRAEHAGGPSFAHVLFVCLHTAGRSQISQAPFERAAAGRHTAASAGTTRA